MVRRYHYFLLLCIYTGIVPYGIFVNAQTWFNWRFWICIANFYWIWKVYLFQLFVLFLLLRYSRSSIRIVKWSLCRLTICMYFISPFLRQYPVTILFKVINICLLVLVIADAVVFIKLTAICIHVSISIELRYLILLEKVEFLLVGIMNIEWTPLRWRWKRLRDDLLSNCWLVFLLPLHFIIMTTVLLFNCICPWIFKFIIRIQSCVLFNINVVLKCIFRY